MSEIIVKLKPIVPLKAAANIIFWIFVYYVLIRFGVKKLDDWDALSVLLFIIVVAGAPFLFWRSIFELISPINGMRALYIDNGRVFLLHRIYGSVDVNSVRRISRGKLFGEDLIDIISDKRVLRLSVRDSEGNGADIFANIERILPKNEGLK